MRIAELSSPALNYWVAKARQLDAFLDRRADGSVSLVDAATGKPVPFQPAIDWSQAGPILAEEWFDIEDVLIGWFGPNWSYVMEFRDDSLTWFMRAFVSLKFGREVEDWATVEEDS